MAAVFWQLKRRNVRLGRNRRIFRDRTHPLDIFDDSKVLKRFRLDRATILLITEEVSAALVHDPPRQGSLTPVLQVLVALGFYATGSLQSVLGDLIGIDQSTVSRTVSRVTDVLVRQVNQHVYLPNQREADLTKEKFLAMRNFPGVIGCIDGTHVRIQAPHEQEHEFVNRKKFHSINVQVICDADLCFINAIAKWPGSVHDAHILRQSSLFTDFESDRPPLEGLILGDSGYMLRPWLMTPLLRPATRQERNYNFSHSSTRCAVERSICEAKQRFQCLRYGMRLQPPKACKVILVCLMLANRARRRRIPQPVDDDDDRGNPNEVGCDVQRVDPPNERARTAAGKLVRQSLVNNY